jgi:hypothetical protein
MSNDSNITTSVTASTSELASFLEETAAEYKLAGRGRLIFGLDATMSRKETWDAAASLQASMFREVSAIGALSLQLVYYRGADECRASGWISDPARLATLMSKIDCRAGATQIEKILVHALKETAREKVGALVFVGDAMEESFATLRSKARELDGAGLPVFMVQEGEDPTVEETFKAIASGSGGAYARFNAGGIKQLGDLLRAVASFATGGIAALAGRKDEASTLLLAQMRKGP